MQDDQELPKTVSTESTPKPKKSARQKKARKTEDWTTQDRGLAKTDSLNAELAKSLRLWKMKTTYNRPDDWVYASTKMNGTQPYWPNSIFRVYIKPAAKKIGLTKRIGWYTFRHTFGTILNANGENPKVIQELLRHANLRVIMDAYVQAMSDEKRKAQSKVVEMIMPGIRKAAR